jgi:hypothetical protein
LRLVIAKPGLPLGRCAIASGNRIACGQRVIAFCALLAACCSAVLNPLPLNCSSERIMFAPSAPLGKAASSSCVNLATSASIFAAETWPLLRCLRCFAASSGANGARTTRIANIIAICFRRLFFIFLSWERPYCIKRRHLMFFTA